LDGYSAQSLAALQTIVSCQIEYYLTSPRF